MTHPVTPSPAATLVLLRDRAPAGVEALLIQRHAKSKFAAGDHVFAGGKVEPEDSAADVERLCRGLTAEEAVIFASQLLQNYFGYFASDKKVVELVRNFARQRRIDGVVAEPLTY